MADRRCTSDGATIGRIEQVTERLLPAGAQRWNIDDRSQLARVAIGQIEQRVDVGDAECVGSDPGTDDLVTGLDLGLR